MADYRLQTLLELRQRAEEAAKEAFSKAMQELAREQRELKRLEEDLARRIRERKARVQAHLEEVLAKGAVGVTAFSTMNRFEDRLKAEEAEVALAIERQEETIRVAEALVEQRRRELTEATIELKAIEKHKETWAKQVKKEREGREELAQEEIGNALHLARTRRS